MVEAYSLAATDTPLSCNAGSGNNQAVGAIVFSEEEEVAATNMSAYIIQTGAATGSFQMAILQPTSISTAKVIAVTTVASAITAGLFTLPLISATTLSGGLTYYFAVYNQVNGSEIAGLIAGFGSVQDAPPINFRTQNLPGLTVNDSLNTSDVSLRISPWLAAHA